MDSIGEVLKALKKYDKTDYNDIERLAKRAIKILLNFSNSNKEIDGIDKQYVKTEIMHISNMINYIETNINKNIKYDLESRLLNLSKVSVEDSQ